MVDAGEQGAFTPAPAGSDQRHDDWQERRAQSLVDLMGCYALALPYRRRLAGGGRHQYRVSVAARTLKADSAFGRNRVSRVMMPPANDWPRSTGPA